MFASSIAGPVHVSFFSPSFRLSRSLSGLSMAESTRNGLSSRIASKVLKTNERVCSYPERPGASKSSLSVRLPAPFFAGNSAELGRNGHSTLHTSKLLKTKARACARAELPGAFRFSLFPQVSRP